MASRRYRKKTQTRKNRSHRRRRQSQTKKGGFMEVLKTAAVPFGLFAAQKYYSGSKKTSRKGRSRRRK